MLRIPLLFAAAALTPIPANAQTFATWNVSGAEKSPDEIKTSIQQMVAETGVPDVLALQEVIDEDQVIAAAEALGLDFWVMSDFSPPVHITKNPFRSLEVAVISSMPIESAGEWDLTGQGDNGDNFAPRPSSDLIPTSELEVTVNLGQTRPSRGFLRADLENGIAVYSVHWKSSLGESCNADDIGFARQREDQAAGLVFDAEQQIEGGRTVVVAGDFNIQAPDRVARSGTSRLQDCAPTNGSCEGFCGDGGLDGYDDSISLLLALDDARLLSKDVPETYVEDFFPGGAIDHLLVAGSGSAAFSLASTPDVTGSSFAGSDHRPVLATMDQQTEHRAQQLIGEIKKRLEELERIIDN
ncbi:MAG: endonuclease/exonuclease/phosphatase family protein [Verrucomicrobiota bacterium]